MPPKRLRSREGSGLVRQPASKFPFRVGDDVEMKSFENGYRGAWFRVQIKKIRLDRRGNILCTMVYKDYSDESEEEIAAFERDPATDQRILMIRPFPPPSVKESNFNRSVQAKLCAVYRDEWEVGDLVDWWYHHCWWTSKVISVVGDGKFQLLCPAPPAGEGGVYLANSRDLRPSLKWTMGNQWSAPPSKEIGKQPCARIVWMVKNYESGHPDFGAAKRDPMRARRPRGRPRMIRLGSPSLMAREAAVAPLDTDRERRRHKEMTLNNLFSRPQTQGVPAIVSVGTKIPQKRGRPRKVDMQEETAATKRQRKISLKVIHPRQDRAYEKAEHMLHMSSTDDSRLDVNEETAFDTEQDEDARHSATPENTTTIEEEDGQWAQEAVTERDEQAGGDIQATDHSESENLRRQLPDDNRRWVKQRRSLPRIPGRGNRARLNHFSNGHSDEAKRRKLEHAMRGSDPSEAVDERGLMTWSDRKAWRSDANPRQCWRGRKNFAADAAAAGQSLLMRRAGSVAVHQMYGHDVLDTREQMSQLPFAGEGKESSAEQLPSGPRQSRGEMHNGELQESDSELFASSYPSSVAANGESKILDDGSSAGSKEALDLKVLKVLNAYKEAFTDGICLEANDLQMGGHDPSSAKKYHDALTNDAWSAAQLSSGGSGPTDTSVVKAYEEALSQDIPRRKSSLAKKESVPMSSQLAKVQARRPTSHRGRPTKVRPACMGVDAKSRTTQGRYGEEEAANLGRHNLTQGLASIRGEASPADSASADPSPESFSGRLTAEEAPKDSTSSSSEEEDDNDDADPDSQSSPNLDLPQRGVRSRKSAPVRLTSVMKAVKFDKHERSSLRERVPLPPVMKLKHKFSLSRKLVDQARREVSAKRRRSCGHAARS